MLVLFYFPFFITWNRQDNIFIIKLYTEVI